MKSQSFALFLSTTVALSRFACAEVSCPGITRMEGAGSSFPAPLYQEAGPLYAARRSKVSAIDFKFDRVNSAYGKERIKMEIGDRPVHFAGTESLLSDEDKKIHDSLKTFPVLAG